MRFKDKAALITGGGRGIGATTALMILGEGGRVGVVDVNEANMKKVVETARSRGYDLKTFVGDVSKKDSVERFMADFIKQFGRLYQSNINYGLVANSNFLGNVSHKRELEGLIRGNFNTIVSAYIS